MDKAYCKAQALWKANESDAFFLISVKQNMVYEVIRQNPETKMD